MTLLNTLKSYLQKEDRNYRQDLENRFNKVRLEEFRLMAQDRL